jgi:hypothetical protein
MKKILLISACLVLVFSACKKDSSKTITTTKTGITATIDGSDVDFSTGATAQAITSSGEYSIQIIGSTGSGSSAKGISVSIYSDKPIVKGTYLASDTLSSSYVIYVENAPSSNPLSFIATSAEAVTITSISSTNIQGTFYSGLLWDKDGITPRTLTNGKFNVSVIQ